MADFCYQCTAKYFGDEFAKDNDMRALVNPESGATNRLSEVVVLCEGCGYTTVDTDGRCLQGGPEHVHEFAS